MGYSSAACNYYNNKLILIKTAYFHADLKHCHSNVEKLLSTKNSVPQTTFTSPVFFSSPDCLGPWGVLYVVMHNIRNNHVKCILTVEQIQTYA